MFKKILVPTDGSPLAEKAIAPAIQFARQIGAGIVGVAVAEPVAFTFWDGSSIVPDIQAAEDRVRKIAEEHVTRIREHAAAAGVACETVVTVSATPYQEIVDIAKGNQCDIIFMATHGRGGINSLLLGSQTQKVLSHSTIPVLVYR